MYNKQNRYFSMLKNIYFKKIFLLRLLLINRKSFELINFEKNLYQSSIFELHSSITFQ